MGVMLFAKFFTSGLYFRRPMTQNPKEPQFGKGFGAGYSIVGAGFQFVFSILFFMGMGYLADRWLDTRPAFIRSTLPGLTSTPTTVWPRDTKQPAQTVPT